MIIESMRIGTLTSRSGPWARSPRRPGLGEFAVGVMKDQYQKSVEAPGKGPSRLTAYPWRIYGAGAMPLAERLTAYAGYTQGFEDSGVAPSTAMNGGAILPTTRTWQLDGGVRFALTPKLTLIAGLFQVNKPYFNFDSHNVDREPGVQRATGLELSAAGQLTKDLSLNAGAVIGQVQVIGPDLAAQGVGSAAVGQPHNQFLVNLDYALTPWWPALSTDLGVYHFGTVPATVDDRLYDSSVTVLNVGGRIKFRMMGAPASLRMQVQNLANAYIWNIALSPGFFQFASRAFVAYLTVDL
jgi:iron complex outermembrane receptor protein